MGDNTAGARRASLSRGAHAGLTVTAGFDPDPSVVQRAQTPPLRITAGLASVSPLSSLDGWKDVAMSPRYAECAELRRSHLLAPPAGGKGAELSAVLKQRLATSFIFVD